MRLFCGIVGNSRCVRVCVSVRMKIELNERNFSIVNFFYFLCNLNFTLQNSWKKRHSHPSKNATSKKYLHAVAVDNIPHCKNYTTVTPAHTHTQKSHKEVQTIYDYISLRPWKLFFHCLTLTLCLLLRSALRTVFSLVLCVFLSQRASEKGTKRRNNVRLCSLQASKTFSLPSTMTT
jgi:hypothetical protein